MPQNPNEPIVLTPTEARGARVHRRGMMWRVLWTSLALAVVAMIVAFAVVVAT